MARTAQKTDPKLWEPVKARVTEGDKGGEPGQWSARKAQLATREYKKAGGGYRGGTSADNSLRTWTREEWGTKSGEESGKTGERYLPKKARKALSDDEYKRTSNKKRADTARGKQFSNQPKDVARKSAAARRGTSGSGASGSKAALSDLTKNELLARARKAGVAGRSRMTKAELADALGG